MEELDMERKSVGILIYRGNVFKTVNMLHLKNNNSGTGIIFPLTLTFIVEATSIIIIDLDCFTAIDTDELLGCWTWSDCLCNFAIDACCCGAVANLPRLSILDGSQN